MLNIWKPADATFAQQLSDLHYASTGERLDLTYVTVLRSDECPYTHYELLRLEIRPHVISCPAGDAVVSARSISYLLHCTATSPHGLIPIIPLPFGSTTLYILNHHFRFRISRQNISSYLILFGLLCSETPFYFFDRISLIESMPGSGGLSSETNIKAALPALFQIHTNGQIDINYSEVRHSPSVKTITARLPCLYRGTLWVTSLRISESGIPEMTRDLALNITHLFDEEENYSYYPLDMDGQTAAILVDIPRRINRLNSHIDRIFAVDKWLNIAIMPVFVYHVLILSLLGFYNPALFCTSKHCAPRK